MSIIPTGTLCLIISPSYLTKGEHIVYAVGESDKKKPKTLSTMSEIAGVEMHHDVFHLADQWQTCNDLPKRVEQYLCCIKLPPPESPEESEVVEDGAIKNATGELNSVIQFQETYVTTLRGRVLLALAVDSQPG